MNRNFTVNKSHFILLKVFGFHLELSLWRAANTNMYVALAVGQPLERKPLDPLAAPTPVLGVWLRAKGLFSGRPHVGKIKLRLTLVLDSRRSLGWGRTGVHTKIKLNIAVN